MCPSAEIHVAAPKELLLFLLDFLPDAALELGEEGLSGEIQLQKLRLLDVHLGNNILTRLGENPQFLLLPLEILVDCEEEGGFL